MPGARAPEGTDRRLVGRTGMHRLPDFARLVAFATAALALAGCGGEPADGDGETAGEESSPRGSYAIDGDTGETSAQYTADDGTTTTMRSGEKVPVSLPAGFALYPGAKVTNNTRVEQADGLLVLLDFESAAQPEELTGFYREQAEAAGIDVATALQNGPMRMIGGESADGASFSFTATRKGEVTRGQLAIGHGLE